MILRFIGVFYWVIHNIIAMFYIIDKYLSLDAIKLCFQIFQLSLVFC